MHRFPKILQHLAGTPSMHLFLVVACIGAHYWAYELHSRVRLFLIRYGLGVCFHDLAEAALHSFSRGAAFLTRNAMVARLWRT